MKFDGLLREKAADITEANPMNIVRRLKGFNLLSSFLFSIGNMECSVIAELFQVVCSSDIIIHMLSKITFTR